ncbi:hypothetical protein EZV77_11970 [Burkholderia thailandensis]|nr:hypothetical protein A8H32_14470 [Burkholderia thailandensis]MDD1483022.1 hypothetical protein [Burkholderia thailandensis]MDD1487512.1 hypothetical protein [Burkholderia thailandensis]MDD1493155.1 hypothetical protein [Burkholderia thailandensis]PJO70978.1 hypothetical protein CWD92_18120 [Burkholderia thailandensis]
MHARACCARAGDGLEGSLPDGWPVRDTAARMPGIARPACGVRRRAAMLRRATARTRGEGKIVC